MHAARGELFSSARVVVNVKGSKLKFTFCTQFGKYHCELTSRCEWRTPSTTFLSTTSVPTTAVLMGLGYFLHAACTTVSQGWLKGKQKCHIHLIVSNKLITQCVKNYFYLKNGRKEIFITTSDQRSHFFSRLFVYFFCCDVSSICATIAD